jgi:hypothetical protein
MGDLGFYLSGRNKSPSSGLSERITMDNQFQDFWGNLWLQMFQGQKQWEGVMTFWQKSLPGVNDWSAMMGKGPQPFQAGSPDQNKALEEACQNFQKLFQDYFKMLGYVPRADYERLQNEYDQLQEEHQLLKVKLEAQEIAIRQMQAVMAAQAMDPAGAAKPLQDMISEQANQFQRLMAGMMPKTKKTSEEEK